MRTRSFPFMKSLRPLAPLLLGLSASLSLAAQRDHFPLVLDSFGKMLEGNEEIDSTILDQFTELRANPELEAGALTGLLRELHPEFAEALRAAADDPEAGIDALGRLAASEDPFLAAESSYYVSRVLLGEERFEEAIPHLEKVRDQLSPQSLRAGEVLYYLGVCNANMLQRTEASDNLNDFVERYPDASPRLVGSAWDLIASLERVHRGSIDDVATHMEFSRRKLGLEDTGDKTQVVQGKIIEMLDELIKRAEEQEKQQPP